MDIIALAIIMIIQTEVQSTKLYLNGCGLAWINTSHVLSFAKNTLNTWYMPGVYGHNVRTQGVASIMLKVVILGLL